MECNQKQQQQQPDLFLKAQRGTDLTAERRREFLYKFFFSYVEIHIENECFPTPLAASMPLFSLVAPDEDLLSRNKNKTQNILVPAYIVETVQKNIPNCTIVITTNLVYIF